MPRRLAASVALAVAVSACVGQLAGSTTTTMPVTPTSGDTTATTVQPPTTTTTVVTTTTEPDLSGLEGLSDEVKSQLEDLIRVVQEIRELPFLSPPNITVVTPEELASRVRESIEEESEDFPADDALYTLLGLLDPEADLETVLLDLYGEQVAGFYDGETGEIVIPARDEGLSLLQQATLIHELVHALTDQHHGFHEPLTAMFDEDRFDEASAYQALIEGDASLAELQWIQTLSRNQIGQLIAEMFEIDSSALETAPAFLQDSLIFPYDTGLAFAQELHDAGGWGAVDEVYENFPGLPASTEQVITPADYGRDLPVTVQLPEIAIGGYELVLTSVWGEAGFRIMLDEVVGPSQAARAADGWGGDTYYQWYDGENAALVIGVRADTTRDLEELEEALLEFAFASVAEEDFVWVEEVGGILYFIVADETEVGLEIRSAVGAG